MANPGSAILQSKGLEVLNIERESVISFQRLHNIRAEVKDAYVKKDRGRLDYSTTHMAVVRRTGFSAFNATHISSKDIPSRCHSVYALICCGVAAPE